MSKQETIRQHWVPRSYLNKFGIERKPGQFQLHALLKEKRDISFLTSTDNLCVKGNMYTLPGETEEERQVIEKIYGDQWENEYPKVYDLITDDAITEIDDETRLLIIGTVTTLLFRTTKMQATEDRLMEQVFRAHLFHSKTTGDTLIDIEGTRIHTEGKSVDELVREYAKEGQAGKTIAQLTYAIKLALGRRYDNIAVVKLNSDDNFITSDHPVGLWNQHGGILAPFSPSNLLSLPVNAKYRIDIVPSIAPQVRQKVLRLTHEGLMATGDALKNNQRQLEQCELYLLGDGPTLDSFEAVRNDQDLARRVAAEQVVQYNALQERARALGFDLPFPIDNR